MNKSFTLIEILVVIVVVGILSSFILIGMSSISDKANIAKSQSFSNSLDNALLLNRVSYWKLNGDTSDSWGLNNGTWTGTGAPNTVVNYRPSSECVSGQCLHFDGVDDMVDFGSDNSLSMGTKDHALSIWVRFDNDPPLDSETIFYCGAIAETQPGYWLYRRTTKNLRLWFSDGSAGTLTPYLTNANVINANVWYYVVVTIDRDGVAQAYLNGQIQTGYSADISTKQGNIANYTSLKIGNTGGSYRFSGKIDEPRIYHGVISILLINNNYFSGINYLYCNNQIALEEFNQRLAGLKYDLVENE